MDDELGVRFQALATDVHRHVRLAPSVRIRAIGDRHRRRTAGGVAGVAAGLTALAGGGAAAVLAPSPAPPPAASPSRPTLPALFTLPHEGKEGWRLNEARNVPLAFERCAGAPDDTLAGRTDARTLSAPDDAVVEQVLVFSDEAAAEAAMAAVMLNCQVLTFPVNNQAFGSTSTGDVNGETQYIARRGNVIFYAGVRGSLVEQEAAWELMAAIGDRLCDTMSLCGDPSWPSPSTGGAHPR